MSGMVCGGVGALAGSFALGRVSAPTPWLVVLRVALAAIGLVVTALGAWKVWGGHGARATTAPAAMAAPTPAAPPASCPAPAAVAATPAAPAPTPPQPPSVPAATAIPAAPVAPPATAPAAPAAVAASAAAAPAPSAAPPAAAMVVVAPPAVAAATLSPLTDDEAAALTEMVEILASSSWVPPYWKLPGLGARLKRLHPFETLAYQCSDPRFSGLMKQFWLSKSLAQKTFPNSFAEKIAARKEAPAPYITMFLQAIGKPDDANLRAHLEKGEWGQLLDKVLGEQTPAQSK